MSKPIEIDLTNQGDRSEGGALPSARAASLRPQPPTASSQSGIPNAGRIHVVALQLIRNNGNSTTHSMSLSWRGGGTEDEALAQAFRYAAETKPDFAIQQWLVGEIPASGIEVAAASETRSGSTEGESPAPEGGGAQ